MSPSEGPFHGDGDPSGVHFPRQRLSHDGAKPCLHGSDAHKLDAVCAPAKERFTWIKGTPSLEALRQALIEPAVRVFIGAAAPASQAIGKRDDTSTSCSRASSSTSRGMTSAWYGCSSHTF